MNDPLLSTLCNICHIDPPKYTCPRCLSQTCSLPCSKRHKLWSSCSGLRDPTKFMPISQLATPAGVDHDYNFIHGIEIGRSRSEKVLIEDLDLVSRKELDAARNGTKVGKRNEEKGDVCVERVLRENRITVLKAPRGMRRNMENTTHWVKGKSKRCVSWQVELWRGEKRDLFHAIGKNPIGDCYEGFLKEEILLKGLSEGERKRKKSIRSCRKARERAGKKAKFMAQKAAEEEKGVKENEDSSAAAGNLLRHSKSSALAQTPPPSSSIEPDQDSDSGSSSSSDDEEEPAPQPNKRPYRLYLHRVQTPAIYGKVLSKLDPEKGLTEQLKGREIMEFPTIYAFDDPLPTSQETKKDTEKEEKVKEESDGDDGKEETNSENEDEEDSEDEEEAEESADSDSDASESEPEDPSKLPKGFMLEEEYLSRVSKKGGALDLRMKLGLHREKEESGSESASEESMDEGEISE